MLFSLLFSPPPPPPPPPPNEQLGNSLGTALVRMPGKRRNNFYKCTAACGFPNLLEFLYQACTTAECLSQNRQAPHPQNTHTHTHTCEIEIISSGNDVDTSQHEDGNVLCTAVLALRR